MPVLVTREIRTRYRSSLLDLAWSAITPIVLLLVYGVILTQSFHVTSAASPYLSSAWAGLVLWTAFGSAVGGGVSSLIASSDLITKVYLPLEAMPLAYVGASLLDLGVGMTSLIVIALVQGVHLGPMSIVAVVPVVVLLVWSAVVAMFSAILAVFVRDTIHVVHLVLRVGFFATPVMYETSFLPRSLAWTAKVNPVSAAIIGLRDTLLRSVSPDWFVLVAQLLVGLFGFMLAVRYIRAVESRAVDVV